MNAKLVLYFFVLASAVIRYMLASHNSSAPSMILDEELYFSISRSLFKSGEVLLRGQPIVYGYLLYPILLVPLHLLSGSVNIYRAIQAFNSIAISLTALPAYLLGKRITESSEKSLFTAVLVLLMPDMIMAKHIMSECIVYPLTLLLLCYFVLAIEDTKRKNTIVCGVLTFLLHITKPGPIVIGIAILLIILIMAMRNRDKARFIQAVYMAGTFLILYILYRFILHFVFRIDFSTTDYYASQIPALTWKNIMNALNGLLVYALYVPAAFLIIPLLLPASQMSLFGGYKRKLLKVVFLSMALFVCSIIWTIYIGEMTNEPFSTRVHIRYLAMFFPVLFAFCLSEEILGAKMRAGILAACAVLFAGWIMLLDYPLISGQTYPVDAHLLSVFLTKTPLNGRIWAVVIWIAVTVFFLYRIITAGFRKREVRTLAVVTVVMLMFSNIASYKADGFNKKLPLAKEAEEAKQLAGNSAMYVTDEGQLFWEDAMVLDMAYRGSLPMVTLSDALKGTGASGVLEAFTPKVLAKAQSAREIQPANRVILSSKLVSSMVFDSAAYVQYTSGKSYAVITPGEGRGWLHSALSGFKDNWVQDGSCFTVFDSNILKCKYVHLQLYVRAGEGTAQLTLTCGSQKLDYSLNSTMTWIEGYIKVDDASKPMTVIMSNTGANVYVQTYLVEGVNAG